MKKSLFKNISSFIRDVFMKNSTSHSYDGVDEFSHDEGKDVTASRAATILFSIMGFLSVFLIWSALFNIDEVSKGNGKVIPSSKEKIIQSMDGGILENIHVKEGQIVDAGQILVQLDVTRTQSTVAESESKYRALLAQQSRLYAEVNKVPLVFPSELDEFTELTGAEKRLYDSRRQQFETSMKNIRDSKSLLNRELVINSRLAKEGASSTVDVIRLKKQLVDLSMKESELLSDYYVRSREELSKVSAEIGSLSQIILGRKDMLSKSTIRSPVRGVVKNIEINTIGGVVPPNGELMNIVPLDDNLLIEAQISPRDIAFIHPGQAAKVKITAYDYSIYGGLDGEVVTISPDTIKDEQKPDLVYYRVYIKTDRDYLITDSAKQYFITPGMVASVDIRTGNKTVLQYLIKPFNKINEALRER
ncbi:HlyD family type I secretion periplasmic adaptor subunit [Morganella morganii]|uniref:HlyD family type I secretion periplasmic adaptor subunit n=1 Tax=Morganella morganii TaxID=582 RepID=UPI002232005F|nr:HlyD family type I secretion periplasmic adaptor subunit [Morganella morganii]EJD6039204.1 HlyD family type I secretion periplasmic adaptor subunit [Morganella morganii]MDM8750545.1 HlyD family type I secretion periplasmic adaptor subunit [Morganella morganii]